MHFVLFRQPHLDHQALDRRGWGPLIWDAEQIQELCRLAVQMDIKCPPENSEVEEVYEAAPL